MPGFPLYLSGWRGHPISNQIKTLLPTCWPRVLQKGGGHGQGWGPLGQGTAWVGGVTGWMEPPQPGWSSSAPRCRAGWMGKGQPCCCRWGN